MYDYTEYQNFLAAAHSAADARTFRSVLRNYLNESAAQWWRGLRDNERQAIILLDFDPSVVTTMVFFGRDWGFSGSYTEVMEAILEKAELLTAEKELDGWDFDLRVIAGYAQAQAQAEQEARAKAATIARELSMSTGISTLETLLMEHSGDVRNHKKWKTDHAKALRKAFLTDALNYLRSHHNEDE